MPATARAGAFIRACTGAAALLLLGCNTPPQVADTGSQPVATTMETTDNKATDLAPATTETPDATANEADNIYFQLRSTGIDEAGKLKLREHAERLKQNPKERVTLIGHMDDLGSRNYNLAITEERLMAVNRQLRSMGVPARQIRRQRAASESSSSPCKTEACRALMRRVELKYSE